MNWLKKLFRKKQEEPEQSGQILGIRTTPTFYSGQRQTPPKNVPPQPRESTLAEETDWRRKDTDNSSDILTSSIIASSFDTPSYDSGSSYDSGISSSDTSSSSDSSFDGFGGGDFGGGGSSGDF